MSRLVWLACGLGALGAGCPGPAPDGEFNATRIAEHSLTEGAILKRGDTFTVTADGSGVVTANFGPRQIARLVTEDAPTATFRAEEFPEGGARLVFALRDDAFGGGALDVGEVWIDLSPPSLVRVDNAEAGAGQAITFWFWDAIALEKADFEVQDVNLTRFLPRAFASTSAHAAEVPADDLPEGELTLSITAWDYAGNSVRMEQEVRVDRTLPTASFVAPGQGTAVTGTLEVELWSEDNLGVDGVELRANGSLVAVLAGGRTTVSLDTSLFPKGALELTATARDRVGNVGEPAVLSVLVE